MDDGSIDSGIESRHSRDEHEAGAPYRRVADTDDDDDDAAGDYDYDYDEEEEEEEEEEREDEEDPDDPEWFPPSPHRSTPGTPLSRREFFPSYLDGRSRATSRSSTSTRTPQSPCYSPRPESDEERRPPTEESPPEQGCDASDAVSSSSSSAAISVHSSSSSFLYRPTFAARTPDTKPRPTSASTPAAHPRSVISVRSSSSSPSPSSASASQTRSMWSSSRSSHSQVAGDGAAPTASPAVIAVPISDPPAFAIAGPSTSALDAAFAIAGPSTCVSDSAFAIAGPSTSVLDAAFAIEGPSTSQMWTVVDHDDDDESTIPYIREADVQMADAAESLLLASSPMLPQSPVSLPRSDTQSQSESQSRSKSRSRSKSNSPSAAGKKTLSKSEVSQAVRASREEGRRKVQAWLDAYIAGDKRKRAEDNDDDDDDDEDDDDDDAVFPQDSLRPAEEPRRQQARGKKPKTATSEIANDEESKKKRRWVPNEELLKRARRVVDRSKEIPPDDHEQTPLYREFRRSWIVDRLQEIHEGSSEELLQCHFKRLDVELEKIAATFGARDDADEVREAGRKLSRLLRSAFCRYFDAYRDTLDRFKNLDRQATLGPDSIRDHELSTKELFGLVLGMRSELLREKNNAMTAAKRDIRDKEVAVTELGQVARGIEEALVRDYASLDPDELEALLLPLAQDDWWPGFKLERMRFWKENPWPPSYDIGSRDERLKRARRVVDQLTYDPPDIPEQHPLYREFRRRSWIVDRLQEIHEDSSEELFQCHYKRFDVQLERMAATFRARDEDDEVREAGRELSRLLREAFCQYFDAYHDTLDRFKDLDRHTTLTPDLIRDHELSTRELFGLVLGMRNELLREKNNAMEATEQDGRDKKAVVMELGQATIGIEEALVRDYPSLDTDELETLLLPLARDDRWPGFKLERMRFWKENAWPPSDEIWLRDEQLKKARWVIDKLSGISD